MNKIRFVSILTTLLAAFSLDAQNLSGYWSMSNENFYTNAFGYVKLLQRENSAIDGEFTANNQKVNLLGAIYDDQTIILTDKNERGNGITFNGQINGDGSISGYYFSNNQSSQVFNWTQKCDAYANPINGNSTPCDGRATEVVTYSNPVVVETEKNTTYRTETRMVKKTIQVAEKSFGGGEMRNENIPLAETVTDIPANAIVVGHIGFDETTTYKTVEVEVPEEYQVAVTDEKIKMASSSSKSSSSGSNKAKTTSNTVVTNSKVPVKVQAESNTSKIIQKEGQSSAAAIPTSFDTPSAKKPANKEFTKCDVGSANPTEKLALMNRGTTLTEKGHTYHIVGAGETMTAICKIYGISITQLASLNNKDCERIYAGEKLIVK